ncbi:DUF58 domain-containing protein, partial [Pelagibacterium halotolerans]|uniref:DUF58 domain-containing protein n=1 Tax=Pelagibacterium halotolerans (strain DSM 22347 / JCM 15775 / CGMCC 1.7692 / B2) TaxID=1082931 RepID=G4RGP5_PELHB
MEFIDHRPYQTGDDTRHLDPHLYARTGEFVVREYSLNQQLPVTIVLDLSGSMAAGKGEKRERAKLVAQLLGFAALAGGDRVQVVVPGDKGNKFSPRWHGAARADLMFDWIAKEQDAGRSDFQDALRTLRRNLPSHGLVIAISDWWDGDISPVLDILFSAGHEVLAVQILTPQEIDPAGIETGIVTIEDAETGEELELAIDAGLLSRYRKLFAARQEELRGLFNSKHWHFVTVSTDDDISQLFTRTLRAQGVLS